MEDHYRKIYFKLNSLNDSLLPLAQNSSNTIHDNLWDGFNALLDELAKLSEDTYYLALKVTPTRMGSRSFILASNFSIKVYQALSYLYSTQDNYLDELSQPQKPKSPADKGQSITQNAVQAQDQKNTQKQEVEVNIEFNQTLSYMTEALIEARSLYKEGTKERSFLDKLKNSVIMAKSTADLIKMIASAAAEFGISADVLRQIFR